MLIRINNIQINIPTRDKIGTLQFGDLVFFLYLSVFLYYENKCNNEASNGRL